MFAACADAERFLASVTVDVLRGAYVDPSAGKVTFLEVANAWLASRTFGESTREVTELRLRLHAHPHLAIAARFQTRSATENPSLSRSGA